jgi:hypothetical protein
MRSSSLEVEVGDDESEIESSNGDFSCFEEPEKSSRFLVDTVLAKTRASSHEPTK